MIQVFLDTVGLLALWDRSDQWHQAASEAYAKLDSDRTVFLTTTFVLAECGNAAARRPYRLAVDRLRVQLEESESLVIPTGDDWRSAWDAYRRGEAARAGIVDQVSIVVMRRLGIATAFTNDQHFLNAGFETLF